MAIVSIPRNEIFQLGQFKAQVITVNTSGSGSHTLDKTTLQAAGWAHDFNFSRVHAIFKFSNLTSKVHYTVGGTGRLASLVFTAANTGVNTFMVVGE